MKQFFLLALCSVVALFSFNSVKAQNAHFITGPCISSDGRTITGTISGLGEGEVTCTVWGEFDCINPAGNEPPSWQQFSLTKVLPQKKNGGNFSLSFTLSSLCNKRWTLRTSGVNVTVTSANATVTETATSCN
jgi:hypothetical protein